MLANHARDEVFERSRVLDPRNAHRLLADVADPLLRDIARPSSRPATTRCSPIRSFKVAEATAHLIADFRLELPSAGHPALPSSLRAVTAPGGLGRQLA